MRRPTATPRRIGVVGTLIACFVVCAATASAGTQHPNEVGWTTGRQGAVLHVDHRGRFDLQIAGASRTRCLTASEIRGLRDRFADLAALPANLLGRPYRASEPHGERLHIWWVGHRHEIRGESGEPRPLPVSVRRLIKFLGTIWHRPWPRVGPETCPHRL